MVSKRSSFTVQTEFKKKQKTKLKNVNLEKKNSIHPKNKIPLVLAVNPGKVHKRKTELKSRRKTEDTSLKNDLKTDNQCTDVQANLINNKTKKKYVMPSFSVKEDLVLSCLDVLQKLDTNSKNKKALLDDETPVFVELRCIKIQKSKGNIKFVLPHSTVASTGEICLITPDLKKGKKVDHEPTVTHWEDILRKADVNNIKTILPMRQLRVEYDQYELKRRLLTQHDFIMVDTRILNHVSHLLGKMFFKKHNMLIPVRLNEKDNIKKDIETGIRTAMLRLNDGHTSTILVGHMGMSQKNLCANVLSLVSQLQTKYPGGESNIRSISLKLPLSLSLPIYLTLRPSNINAPKLIHKKPKHYTVLEDELSTIPGRKVRVAPDGTVHVIKSQIEIASDMEEDIENLPEPGSE